MELVKASHREPVEYLPIDLKIVAKKLQLDKTKQFYVDVIAIPDMDFGRGPNKKSPRRIRDHSQAMWTIFWNLQGGR